MGAFPHPGVSSVAPKSPIPQMQQHQHSLQEKTLSIQQFWLLGHLTLFSNLPLLPPLQPHKEQKLLHSFPLQLCIIYNYGNHILFMNIITIFLMLPFQFNAFSKSNGQKNIPKDKGIFCGPDRLGYQCLVHFLKRNFSLRTESIFPRVGDPTLLRWRTTDLVSNLHSRSRSKFKIL